MVRATGEVLIIGGGAGGLFAAFMLRDLGSKVCLVEKQPYFGGKLQVIGPGRPVGSSANGSSNPYGIIGTAGMRIDETQAELRCLAQQLGVKADSSENSLLINVKDRWVRGDADPLLLSPAGELAGGWQGCVHAWFCKQGQLLEALMLLFNRDGPCLAPSKVLVTMAHMRSQYPVRR